MLKLAETDSEFSKTPAATDAPVQSYEEAQRHNGTRAQGMSRPILAVKLPLYKSIIPSKS